MFWIDEGSTDLLAAARLVPATDRLMSLVPSMDIRICSAAPLNRDIYAQISYTDPYHTKSSLNSRDKIAPSSFNHAIYALIGSFLYMSNALVVQQRSHNFNIRCLKLDPFMPCIYKPLISRIPYIQASIVDTNHLSALHVSLHSSAPVLPSVWPSPSTFFTFPTLLLTVLLLPPASASTVWAFSASLLGGHSPSFFHPATSAFTTSLRLIGTVGARPCIMILL